jgi:predicted dehydrogenase
VSDGVRVGIVGCGLIGRKRAEALAEGDELVGCHDLDTDAAQALADDFGCEAVARLDDLLSRDLDVIVVATTHDQLTPIGTRALEAEANVLVEKPAGIGVADIERLEAAASAAGRRVKVGFNHRFHPGTERALEAAASGRFGDVMFARARYGHGGRLGYEKEWRMRPEISGGGELIDQGMHVLDLFHSLLGAVPLHSALLRTQYWDAPVEDNAVLTVAEPGVDRPWATAHVTWTEWKNLFSFEIYCRTGKLHVEGLARSYGAQRLTIHAMKPELGPPDTEVVEYAPEDLSWRREWAHFREALIAADDRPLRGDLESARYAWDCVERAYELNEWGR